jgi:lysophospholipase L1-like esterase
VRWRLTNEELSLNRFAASGFSGVDLYWQAADRWGYLGTGLPERFGDNEATVVEGLASGRPRTMHLNLPLFNGVERVEIGVEEGARLDPVPSSSASPVCFYGTSIVQGGCASRPGMAHVAQLRRRLDRPMLNLGLAGNGQTHGGAAALLGELDVAAHVIDPLPNMDAARVEEMTEPFLRTLASARPSVPILLVGSIRYAGSSHQPELTARLEAATAAQDAIVERLRDAGHTNLRAVPGHTLLGDDDEATVDTVHPNDLGFVRMADAFEARLRELLPPPAT